MDWVVCVGYGSAIVVPPATTNYLILYPIPDFFAGDSEFLREDEEESSLFYERIVGDVTAVFEDEIIDSYAWCILPMGVDYQSLSVLPAYTGPWNPNSSEWANERFWDKRLVTGRGTLNTPQLIDHPYWTQVDIHPRHMAGSKKNVWPVLALFNPNPNVRLIVQHHLRALVK